MNTIKFKRMENIPQILSTFQFTNLTNRHSDEVKQHKKSLIAHAKTFLSGHHKPDPSAENKNTNLNELANNRQFDFKNSTSNLQASEIDPINLQQFQQKTKRSLKKVNMDFFRNKKMVFKHSNVRISFEIVQSLSN